MGLIRDFVSSNKSNFCKIIFLIVSSSLIGIPLPYISKLLIDNVLINKQYGTLKTTLFLFLCIVTMQIVIGRISAIKNADFILSFNEKLRKEIFNNNLEDISKSKDISNIQTIIANDIELLCTNALQIIIVFFGNITTLLGYMIMIIYISPKLSFFSVLFIPLYIYWIVHVSKKLKILNMDLQVSKSSLIGEVSNVFSNLMVINIYNLISDVKGIFYRQVDNNIEISKKIIVYNNFVSIVSTVIVTGAAFVPLFIGVSLVKNGNITVGELIAFNSYCSLLFTPVTSLLQLITTIKTTQVYEERYIQYNKNSFIERDERVMDFGYEDATNKGLEVVHLSILKSKETLVEDINITTCPGEVIRLVGGNASGKTLFLKTLVQINNNYRGDIFFNGEHINKVAVKKISEKIVYVSNNQGLYFEMLIDNLVGNKHISEKKILEVLELVQLEKRIQNIPEGLNVTTSYILEKFSNGELQKIRIARALLQSPDILILDEIFSNIDIEQTKTIFENIRNNYQQLCIIFVEHHLDTEIKWDVEWVICNGKLKIRGE